MPTTDYNRLLSATLTYKTNKMITLTIILLIISLISQIKVYKECKKRNIPFNPLGCGFGTWVLCFMGYAIISCILIYLIVTKLP